MGAENSALEAAILLALRSDILIEDAEGNTPNGNQDEGLSGLDWGRHTFETGPSSPGFWPSARSGALLFASGAAGVASAPSCSVYLGRKSNHPFDHTSGEGMNRPG